MRRILASFNIRNDVFTLHIRFHRTIFHSGYLLQNTLGCPCYSWLYKTFRLSHYDELSSFHLSENLDYKRPLSLLYISSEKVREAFQVIISISLNNTQARRRDPSLFPRLCPISSDHEANCLTLRPTYPTVLPLPVRSLSQDRSITAWRRHFWSSPEIINLSSAHSSLTLLLSPSTQKKPRRSVESHFLPPCPAF